MPTALLPLLWGAAMFTTNGITPGVQASTLYRIAAPGNNQ